MKENRNFSDGNESERIGYSILNLKETKHGKCTLLDHQGCGIRETFLNGDLREIDKRNSLSIQPIHT